jgi:hypothetical protein
VHGKFEITAKNETGGGSLAPCTSSLDLRDLEGQNDTLRYILRGLSSCMHFHAGRRCCVLLVCLCTAGRGASLHGWLVHAILRRSGSRPVSRNLVPPLPPSVFSTLAQYLSHIPHLILNIFKFLGRYSTTHSCTLMSLARFVLHALWSIIWPLLCWRARPKIVCRIFRG